MDPLTLQTAARYAGGTLRGGDPSGEVLDVTTDTRSLASGQLFVALRGEHFDGHDFLAQAAQTGAVGAMVCAGVHLPVLPPNFAHVEVEDTLHGYQRLAAAYRRQLVLRVVGITGSNGKTSTKDFTAAVLERRFKVLKTEGNLNNHIGVPRMLLRADATYEVAVLEMGMNHPGEIAPLAAMAAPEVAIITNIGTAHLEFMRTKEAIAQEKGMLVEAIGPDGCVILPAEDPFAGSLAARTAGRVMTAGLRRGDIRAEHVRHGLEGSAFEVVYNGARAATSIPVPGEHMITNALLAIGAGLALGLTLDEAAAGLANASLTKGRLQVRQVGDLQVIDDTYNANPDSMVAALNTVGSLPALGRRIAVLGRMGELGAAAEAGHQRVGAAAGAAGFDCVITVGAEAAVIGGSATAAGVDEVHSVETNDDAAALLSGLANPGDLILVKGSRSAGMERIIASLSDLRGALAAGQRPALH